MNTWDYWRLCDELSVQEAAELLVGVLPGEVEANAQRGDELTTRSLARYCSELSAARTAIATALKNKQITGKVTPLEKPEEAPDLSRVLAEALVSGAISALDIDPYKSKVQVKSLRQWLKERGFTSGFFFPTAVKTPDYLDRSNPRYAAKLAAAVQAWLAVAEPGKVSAKQALLKWLREHAAEFSLTDGEGKLNETGIEEVAKVANWKPEGGAPKTPGD